MSADDRASGTQDVAEDIVDAVEDGEARLKFGIERLGRRLWSRLAGLVMALRRSPKRRARRPF